MTEAKIKEVQESSYSENPVSKRQENYFIQHEHESRGFTKAEKFWLTFVIILLLECLREFINYSDQFLRW